MAAPSLGVSDRVTPWRQRTASARIARACACLCLSLGVACGSHVEAPPVASLSLRRGPAGASSRFRPRRTKLFEDFGFEHFTLQHGGFSREFYVYVPTQVKMGTPASGLVMFFHGKAETANDTCLTNHPSSFAAKTQADVQGFLAVCPAGLTNETETHDETGWNAGHCCGYPSVAQIDDVGFVSAMLDELRHTILPGKGVAYPEQNVFSFGFSTGGLFSYRLACELQDKIHGVAPSGSTFGHSFMPEGHPWNRIPWALECRTSLPMWGSLGTFDRYTTEKQGVDGFVKYAKMLGCDTQSCRPTDPVAGVECLEYTRCPDHPKAKFCMYDAEFHTVRAFLERFNHGHVAHAWKFLTRGALKGNRPPDEPDAWASVRKFLFGSRHLITKGCPSADDPES